MGVLSVLMEYDEAVPLAGGRSANLWRDPSRRGLADQGHYDRFGRLSGLRYTVNLSARLIYAQAARSSDAVGGSLG